MSFFADMLAGTAAGLGQGMINYAQMDEREKQEELARQEKAELAKQLAQQRSDDKAAQIAYQKEALAARYGGDGGSGGSSGSGGGGRSGGINLMQMAIQAQTTEEQDKVVRLASTLAGPDAAAQLADKFFGRPLQDRTKVVDQDDAKRIANDPMLSRQGAAPATRERGGNVAYSADKGAEALQRVYALLGDPSKMDDVVKGQRGAMLMDNAKTAGSTISNPVERATLEQSLSNPTTTQASVDAKEYAADKSYQARVDVAGLRSAKSELKGATGPKISSILNSANATIKSLNDSGKGSTPEARAQWAEAMSAAQDLRSAALAAQGDQLKGAPAPKTNTPANRPPLSSFFK